MSRPDHDEPLAPDIVRLLDAERSRPSPPSDMRSRVLERLGHDLLDGVLGPPAGGGGGGGGDDGGGAPPAGAAPGAAASSALLGRWPMAVSLLALGGLGGAALHAVLRPPERTTVYVPAAAPAAATAASAAPPPIAPPPVQMEPPSSPALPPVAARRPPPAGKPAAAPAAPPVERERQLARDAEIAAERALLEQARTALARGKPGDALAVLSRHERQFAHGQLVEEREALQILSLVAAGHADTARTLVPAFKERFPHSMLLRAIEGALDAAAPAP